MPAYVIVQQRVSDPDADALRRYREASGPLVAHFGGRYLVRGGPIDVLEGWPRVDRVVLIEFPDLASARAWFDSPEYQGISALRRSAAESELLLVDGVD